LTDGETAARSKPAERVGDPVAQSRDIVEGEDMAIVRGDEQVAVFAGKRS